MKYSYRTVISVLALLLGIVALTQAQSHRILPAKAEGKVFLRFLECAGKRSVFILDNQTDNPIYVRSQRVDYWKEFKDANIELGVHFIEYKAPHAQNFEDASFRWDAPMPFKMVPPHSQIRYGVDFWKGQGEYKVIVPYMEMKDADLVQRMNKGIGALTKRDDKRLETTWKEVVSDSVVNTCK